MKRILLGLVMLTALVVSLAISVPAQGRPPNFCLRHPNSPKCVSPTPTTPAPTTSTTAAPGGDCTGVSVSPGGGLKAAMDSFSTPHTFCLGAGTYTVSDTIRANGDTVIGAGMSATHIDGSSIPETNGRIFISEGAGSTFRDLDIFGARTPAAGQTTCRTISGTQGNAACGKAFVNNGGLKLTNVRCHDNGGNCASGSGNYVLHNINCFDNGNAYSMTSGFAYAGCVKQAASYSADGGGLVLTDSFIHDQLGNGIWCDYCKYADWDIHTTVFEANGNHAIQWEMSGNWTCCQAHALVSDNTFIGNGTNLAKFAPGGMIISTAGNITVEHNTFDGTNTNAITIIYSNGRIDSQNYPTSQNVIIRNNTLNGDPLVGCGLAGVTCSGNS